MCPAASPPARLPAQLPGAPSPADPRERTLHSPFLGRLCSPVHTLVRDACGFRFLQPFSTWSRRVGGLSRIGRRAVSRVRARLPTVPGGSPGSSCPHQGLRAEPSLV